MENLLKKSEQRQLKTIEILYHKDDWMTLEELSRETKSSIRILKYDFDYFKKRFQDFTIESSTNGVRVNFPKNIGLKSFYNKILEDSLSFQLLETLFFNEESTVLELAESLYLSPSTLYRTIEQINKVSIQYGFHIKKNPCQIIGDEVAIRSFFSKYFYEKYTHFDWPYFSEFPQIDEFVQIFVDYTKIPLTFARYNMMRSTVFINHIRLSKRHRLDIKPSQVNLKEAISDLLGLEKANEILRSFQVAANMNVSEEMVHQLLVPFIYTNFSVNSDTFQMKRESNKLLNEHVSYIESMLDRLSLAYDIPIPNKNEISHRVMNAIYYEAYDPRSEAVLYNRNKYFAKAIEENFECFYHSLYNEVKLFLELVKLPITENRIYYYIYTIYSSWEKLTRNLRTKNKKIKILVISNRDVAHSNMIKNFIDYEYSNHSVVDVFDQMKLSIKILEKLDYDLIVSNFQIPPLESKRIIYIENVPVLHDFRTIQNEINRIFVERRTAFKAKLSQQ